VAALESGRTSWTAVLDAIRLSPDDDEAEVTAAQVREVVSRQVLAAEALRATDSYSPTSGTRRSAVRPSPWILARRSQIGPGFRALRSGTGSSRSLRSC
jgi:hypothetical protein